MSGRYCLWHAGLPRRPSRPGERPDSHAFADRVPSPRPRIVDGTEASWSARGRRGPSRPAAPKCMPSGVTCDPLVAPGQSPPGCLHCHPMDAHSACAFYQYSRARAFSSTGCGVSSGVIAAIHRLRAEIFQLSQTRQEVQDRLWRLAGSIRVRRWTCSRQQGRRRRCWLQKAGARQSSYCSVYCTIQGLRIRRQKVRRGGAGPETLFKFSRISHTGGFNSALALPTDSF